ncbi:MAG TPA: hypothetical protein VMU94_15415 [Streptosporangiaceae bacterium]|nr:hypothetical protein [Streptosporangiaceae bacterium]
MRVTAVPGPDSALPVHEVPLIGRQPLIACPAKLVADVPHAVSVLGVRQRLRAPSPHVHPAELPRLIPERSGPVNWDATRAASDRMSGQAGRA